MVIKRLLVWVTVIIKTNRIKHWRTEKIHVLPPPNSLRQTRPNNGITIARTTTVPPIRRTCRPGQRGRRTWRAPLIRRSSGATWSPRFRAAFWRPFFRPIGYSAPPLWDRPSVICSYRCASTWILSFWFACELFKDWLRYVTGLTQDKTGFQTKMLSRTQGVTYPSCHGIWRFWAPPLERSRLATIAFSGSYAGVVIGLPVSGFLAAISWQAPFYFYSTVGFIWYVYSLMKHNTHIRGLWRNITCTGTCCGCGWCSRSRASIPPSMFMNWSTLRNLSANLCSRQCRQLRPHPGQTLCVRSRCTRLWWRTSVARGISICWCCTRARIWSIASTLLSKRCVRVCQRDLRYNYVRLCSFVGRLFRSTPSSDNDDHCAFRRYAGRPPKEKRLYEHDERAQTVQLRRLRFGGAVLSVRC